MTRRVLCVFIVYLFTATFCHSQTPLYHCNFDKDSIDDCTFTQTSGAPDLISTVGINPLGKPTRPLSDVTSVLSPTTPDNQACQLPYAYSPGNWAMHFCQRNNNDNNFTCPTESGTGQCVIGKYGLVRTPNNGAFDHTYSTEVANTGGAVQCLDFYYYVTSAVNNAKISVGWDEGADPQSSIVEVTALADNKWQHSRTTFKSAASETYRILFRMTRDTAFGNFYYALDEIKIFDGPCGSPSLRAALATDTTDINNQNSVSTAELTTGETITTTIVFSDTTAQSSVQTVVENITSPGIPEITTVDFILTTAPSPLYTTTATTSTTTTTLPPPVRLFECDFSTETCFVEDGNVAITNGTQFSVELSGDGEPPRAPVSDVTSITKPTNNNELCSLPYQLPMSNNTNTTWDMWFCYQNRCPTINVTNATCASGAYGLISLEPQETNKTITQSIDRKFATRDATGEQCLRYQYYFTVYDRQDWGQQIRVSIIPDNVTADEFVIDTLNITDMSENRWYSRNKTFNSTWTNYTLIFRFEVTNANRTIYFALDDIELYDNNCSYVDLFPDQPDVTTPSTTTTGPGGTPPAPSKINNLNLILGLSLGLGIPAILAVIGVLVCHFKTGKSKKKIVVKDRNHIPMSSTSGLQKNI